jgi:hypothetical protein
MKDTIKQIIESNLPEEKIISNIKFNSIQEDYSCGLLEGEILGHNQCLSQINTTLIADEVLKVVGETKRDFIIRILGEQHKNELQGKGYDFYFVLRTELDYLSPNKENKNND